MKQDLHRQTDLSVMSINPAPNAPKFWGFDVSPPGNCEKRVDRLTLLKKTVMSRFVIAPDCMRDFPYCRSGFFMSGYKQSARADSLILIDDSLFTITCRHR